MYISRIYLKNIGVFGELNLSLTKGETGKKRSLVRPRMRTLIIGRNGTGKTTLLRSIAVGLADEKDASGLLAEETGRLVTVGQKSARIEIDLLPTGENSEPITIKTLLGSQEGQDFLERKDPRSLPKNILVCGYGVGRSHQGPETGREYRIIDSVYSLFQYDTPLIGIELTLRRLRDYLGTKLYTETMQRIKQALGLGLRDRIDLPKGGGVTISGPEIGKGIPVGTLGDGYAITFLWILDVFAWALRAECITPSGEICGILLLDELEQHLHPSLEIEVLNRLNKLFPRLQIIGTTHSPLVTLGAEPSEVVVLRRKGKKVVVMDVPDFSGYSAEDMLADSKLFDSDVYSPETSKKLDDYRKLISIPAIKRTNAQKTKLKSLTAELMAQEVLGDKESKIDKELSRLIEKYGL